MPPRFDGANGLPRPARRRLAQPGADTSPQAVEASLAAISAAVTAEAVERRQENRVDRGGPPHDQATGTLLRRKSGSPS